MVPTVYNHTNPPWDRATQWCEANQTLAHLVQLHGQRLQHAKILAGSLSAHFESVFPRLDALCQKTCPWCPEPCCTTATVWFDFKDLVFLHVSKGPIPSVQVTRDSAGRCCYLSPKGCVLDRFRRPWICTWYVCETQKRLLKGQRHRRRKQTLEHVFREIKGLRLELETAFVNAIC